MAKKHKEESLDKVENINERKTTLFEKFSLKIRKNLITNNSKTMLLIIIIILAFISLNLWANTKDLAQIDITENKLYSLTDVSKEALKDINTEVNIYVYGYDERNAYVNLVKQYAAFNSNIKYQIVDESTNYEVMTKYDMGIYNEILVVANDRDVAMYPDYQFATQEYVNGVLEDVDLTEESITNAILKVTDSEPAKIYFVEGHGESTKSEIATLLNLLESSVYEYEFLNLLSTSEIPSDCDVLAILAPTNDYTESEATVVKNYINNGGNIMMTLTTVNRKNEFINFQTILDLYAITIEDAIIYEGNANNCMSYGSQSIPIVLIPNLSTTLDITNSIKKDNLSLILSIAQAIIIDYDKIEELGVSPQELLYTSVNAYNVKDYKNEINIEGIEPDVYTIASKFTKSFGTEGEEGYKESQLILITNDTFLADYDSIIGEYPIGYGANSSFAMNCFSDLSEKENTLSIAKGSNVTTFTPTAKDDRIVKLIVFGLPIVIIVFGIVVWILRKRKR